LGQQVEIADYGALGLGLRLKEKVARGEEVIRIPQKAMLSVDTAKASSIGTLIERDPLLKTMPNVVLAIHLLIERNSPASLWEPYINVLPHSYNTVLYFTPKQLEGLKGSPALEDALKQYKFVARQYAYFYRLFANTLLKDYLTYDEYRWAVSTVMTRQNVVPRGEASESDNAADSNLMNTLIPLWDMANHEQGEISTDYDLEARSSICLAHREFAAGEQLTIFYGVRSNSDLLIHNGFVYPANPDDSLRLRLGVAKTDPLAAARLALLERVGVVSQKFQLRRTPTTPLEPKLVAFLRVLQMDAPTLGEWHAAEDPSKILDIEVR
jgi:protein-histidine N-methyltransferase